MTLPPLSNATLAAIRGRNVQIPAYDRSRIPTGIVHSCPVAYHRVHQACYFDDALAQDPRWGICAVSLKSAGVRDALAPQDGLYGLAILDTQSSWRVIGSIRDLLVAPESPAALLDRLTNPATKLVTATITEKGYCLTSDGGLDAGHPEIRRDIATPEAPVTFVGFLVEALRRRRAATLPPFNVVSCDNLVDNGTRLR